MSRSGTVLVVVLVAAMIVTTSIFLIPRNDDGGDDADKIVSGKFNYPSMFSEKDYTDICYFSDGYFKKPSTEYNASLATATLCFALSSFMSANDDGGYSYKYRNAEAFLNTFGFDNIEANEAFKTKPTKESVGVVFGEKEIVDEQGKHTLIAVGVRGGSYGAEFAGNFIIGPENVSEGHHKGFYDAAKITIDELGDYILDKGITGDIKVWITGYSRSAAISNVAAGLMDTSIAKGDDPICDAVTLEKDDLYAYSFGTPAGVFYESGNGYPDPSSSTYNNIWSIINKNDLVPMVAMESAGFHRYGTDMPLPNVGDEGYEEAKNKMLPYYEAMDSRSEIPDYPADEFVAYRVVINGTGPDGIVIEIDTSRPNVTQRGVLIEFMDSIFEVVGEREGYVANVQEDLVNILDGLYSNVSNDREVPVVVGAISQEIINANIVEDLMMAIIGNDEAQIATLFSEPIRKGFEAAGVTMSEAKANEYAGNIASCLISLRNMFLIEENRNNLTSIMMNWGQIGGGHRNEVYFAWMKSMDPNYQ